MFEFLPSTRHLFKVLEFDWLPEPENDKYPISAALTAWENRLYKQLSEKDFKNGTWPASPALLSALRAALSDQRGNYAGDKLAYCLVRCSCRQPETISGLCAWDSQLFLWRDAGLSAEDLLNKFQSIGAAGNPQIEDLQRLNHWLSDPGAALAHYSSGNLAETVLKGKIIYGRLYSDELSPKYVELFQEFAAHTVPALPISNVIQKPLEDEPEDITEKVQAQMADIIPDELKNIPIFQYPETFWQIDFDFEGTTNTVYVSGDFTWVNDAGLALQFDNILAQLGRSERVIRLGDGRNDTGSSWGLFIIADPLPFAALCNELGIPLNDFTGALSKPNKALQATSQLTLRRG